jgi:hypothetical protein
MTNASRTNTESTEDIVRVQLLCLLRKRERSDCGFQFLGVHCDCSRIFWGDGGPLVCVEATQAEAAYHRRGISAVICPHSPAEQLY